MYLIRKELIAMSEQEPELIDNSFAITLDNHVDKKYLNLLMEIMNLSKNKLHNYNSLSGGEKQKLSILLALVKRPDVLLLDEPTSALDVITSKNLIKQLTSEKATRITIIVTHDNKFDDISDHTIFL